MLFISSVLLSGCSSSELSYDPVELIEYERCLNTVPIQYTEDIWSIEGFAEKHCENKKPVLK
jgi:hypothetical protein